MKQEDGYDFGIAWENCGTGGKHIVMDCGGIGYFIHVPQSVIYNLPNDGSVCTIFTILNISKTDVSNDSAVGLGENESIPLAIEALVSLGYKRKEAVAAVMGVDTGLSVEKIVSQALKNLY